MQLKNQLEIIFGKHSIRVLPNNFRSIQGFHGDFIFDEFHLYHSRIWTSVVPSITAVGGSVTICGIPSWFGGKLLRNIRVSGNNLNCIN